MPPRPAARRAIVERRHGTQNDANGREDENNPPEVGFFSSLLGPDEIAYPIRSVFRRQENTNVTMAAVKAIDGTELTYDYLVIAAGAKPSYFGHDEWSSFAPGLKSLEDALDFRRRLFLSLERAEREAHSRRREELLTFVVVGGGPYRRRARGCFGGDSARRTAPGLSHH